MRMREKILIFGEIAAAGTSKFVYAKIMCTRLNLLEDGLLKR